MYITRVLLSGGHCANLASKERTYLSSEKKIYCTVEVNTAK